MWGCLIVISSQRNCRLEETDEERKRANFFMIVATFIMLMKTFFFLRLFYTFSSLVTMMKKVAFDLRYFLVFYFILLWILSLVFVILELGNYTNPRNPNLR
jgi:uncharacterized Tic20 family protein